MIPNHLVLRPGRLHPSSNDAILPVLTIHCNGRSLDARTAASSYFDSLRTGKSIGSGQEGWVDATRLAVPQRRVLDSVDLRGRRRDHRHHQQARLRQVHAPPRHHRSGRARGRRGDRRLRSPWCWPTCAAGVDEFARRMNVEY